MKLFLAAVMATAFMLGCTKNDPGQARNPQNIDGARRGVAPPTDEQRKAMSECIAKKGQKLPERPNFSEAQRQAMVKCKTENREAGMAAFQKCVAKAGVKLPEPPSPELRKAVMECRQEVMPVPGAPPR